jgi:hypothetical protein
MKRWISFAAVAVALAFPGLARAATISTLFNTGVDSTHTVLPDGTIGDPHYTLTSVPGGTTDIRIRSTAGGYPYPPTGPYFVGDQTKSLWIGPNNAPTLNSPVGEYTYQTTFDLSAYNYLTASISGLWSTDNQGLHIYLNGIDILAAPTSAQQYKLGFAAFNLPTADLLPHLNTLQFVVRNMQGNPHSLNPEALRVELTGTADLTIPEPASLAVFGTFGALGLVGLGWRRRKPVA